MLTTRSSLTNGLGMPKAKLPTIQHPSARLGDKLALHLRGDSRMGHNIALAGVARPRRERTEPAMATGQSLPNLPKLSENQHWTGGRSLPRENGGMYTCYPRMNTYSADNYILNRNRSGAKPQELGIFEFSEIIREKLRTGVHGVKQLFKSNDPTGQGIVSREGLMKVLFNLCGYISSDQYNNLLRRLGLDGKSSLNFDQFIGCFQDSQSQQPQWVHPVAKKEIEEAGQHRPFTASPYSSNRRPSSFNHAPTPNQSPERKQASPQVDPNEFIQNEDNSSKQTAKPFRVIKKSRPNLEHISDCLHYRFEEPYNAMKSGFQAFDFLNDGFVSRMDFRNVLKEFGFPCQAIDIEVFLARCGLKIQQGLTSYNDFLTRFWNRSENGLVNRIATNHFHVYSQDQGLKKAYGEYLTPEEMEAAMVDFFHGDFLALLGVLKKCDNDQQGVINPHELRNAINKVLNTNMSESQWQHLQDYIGTDKDGLIQYGKYLESFNTQPGLWNKKMHNGVSVAKVRQTEVPGEVEALRDRAREVQENVVVEPQGRQDIQRHKLMGRPADQLHRMAHEVFMNKFHDFDIAFKRLDRKMTGLFNKDQFRYLLKECGVDLTLIEVDRLGKSMAMGQEGLFSYSAVLRHFIHGEPSEENHNTAVSPGETQITDASEDLSIQELDNIEHDTFHYEKSNTKPKSTNKHIEPIEKIREDVVNRWDAVKSVFRNTDKAGTSLVTAHEMKELMEMFDFNVNDEEQNKIISQFLVSPGSVNYMKFLEHFSRAPASPQPVIQLQAQPSREFLSVTKLSCKPPWQRKITQDWKNIKRAFKKADKSNLGEVQVTDFQKILTSCGIDVPDEMLYNILSSHDPELKGTVNYETFINHCLTAF